MKNNSHHGKFKVNFNLLLLSFGTLIAIASLLLQLIIPLLSSYTPNPQYPLNNPDKLWYPTTVFTGIWIAISTFTIQSNILVACFFGIKLLRYLQKPQKNILITRYGLALTVYINITMIIFFVALFKPMLEKLKTGDNLDVIGFANTFCLHLVTPIIMTCLFLFNTGQQRWSLKDSMKRAFPLTIGYMILYLVCVLIKGTLVGQLYTNPQTKTQEIRYSYPYPFLNFKSNPAEFVAYFFIILALFLILYFGYFWYNNVRNERLTLKLK